MFKSIKKSRLVMAGGTLACAMGIGVLMQMGASSQTSEALPELATALVNTSPPATDAEAGESIAETPKVQERAAVDTAEAAADPLAEAIAETKIAFEPGTAEVIEASGNAFDLKDVALTRAEPVPPAAAPQPAALPAGPVEVELAALGDAPLANMPAEETSPAFTCEIEMAAETAEVALVALDLNAPCMINERFTLHHNGMMITVVTDDEGRWSGQLPALSQQALFIAAFPNGDGAVANAEVLNLSDYDRYVVQWKGYSGVQIHALEYGADYGQDGHVWHDTARDASVAARGEGGFLMRLGEAELDQALLAEVYTFPTAMAQREGDVGISLETEITQRNCGRDIEAQVLVKTAQGVIGARDLELAMPDCNAVGDFLVLKNLYEDLKIARN